jgi:RNA polymerase sigma-70 factor (ECF subfamily)
MANHSLIITWRQRWNRNLIRFLRRRVRVSVDVEDLAQETYVRLLRARDLRDVRNPQAYLLRVAGNVIAEWRERQPPHEPLPFVDEDQLIEECDLECNLDTRLTQLWLDKVVATLPPATRAVLILRFRDDLSAKEIIAQLGMTERQVRRHLIKGYEYLRQSFAELKGVRLG